MNGATTHCQRRKTLRTAAPFTFPQQIRVKESPVYGDGCSYARMLVCSYARMLVCSHGPVSKRTPRSCYWLEQNDALFECQNHSHETQHFHKLRVQGENAIQWNACYRTREHPKEWNPYERHAYTQPLVQPNKY
jgi:hypothetical protein